MIRRGRLARLSGATVVLGAIAASTIVSPGDARVIPRRTFLISQPIAGGGANGPSAHPALSGNGTIVAFDTGATNLGTLDANGPARDVVVVNLVTGERRLVSEGGDRPSFDPVLSRSGGRVAFVSQATNLFGGDSNGVADIFIRDGRGAIQLVSIGKGGFANGPSSEPDISADGRFVVFTSSASNLVVGDRNGRTDIFVRDVRAHQTTRVSVSSRGAEADRASAAPAISADGRFVSFASHAHNLVAGRENGVADVFVRDLRARRTERVSVSSDGRQQNRGVARPFTQLSDLSGNGRYVVFESDATNLARDANRHTDVFRRDRRTRHTVLVSANSSNYQGNNDSFAPTITPSGHFVAFQSFAGNLARGSGPREDVFVRDVVHGTTTVINVPAGGGQRAPELVKQLLQRPVISGGGEVAAFTSTVPNLVAGDANGIADVFVRFLAAPSGSLVRRPRPARRPVVELGADDPMATGFVCRIDARTPFLCPRGEVLLPRLPAGRHVLSARAGGPGMLFDFTSLRVPFMVTARGPLH